MMTRISPVMDELAMLSEKSFSSEPLMYDRTEGTPNLAPRMPWHSPSRDASISNSMRSNEDGNMESTEKCELPLPREAEEIRRSQDSRMRYLAGELSPLLDRLGRALTDIAPHLRYLADHPPAHPRQWSEGEEEERKQSESMNDSTNSASNMTSLHDDTTSPGNMRAGTGSESIGVNAIGNEDSTTPGFSRTGGFDALETLTSMLRSRRAPSPPPERAYRQNISTTTGRGNLTGLGGRNGNHVDIHIHAILTSPRPNTNTAVNTTPPAASSSPDTGIESGENTGSLERPYNFISLTRSASSAQATSAATTTSPPSFTTADRNPFAPDVEPSSEQSSFLNELINDVATERAARAERLERESTSSQSQFPRHLAVGQNIGSVPSVAISRGGGGMLRRGQTSDSLEGSPLTPLLGRHMNSSSAGIDDVIARASATVDSMYGSIDGNGLNRDFTGEGSIGHGVSSPGSISPLCREIGSVCNDSERSKGDYDHTRSTECEEDEYELGKRDYSRPVRKSSEERTALEEMSMMSAEQDVGDTSSEARTTREEEWLGRFLDHSSLTSSSLNNLSEENTLDRQRGQRRSLRGVSAQKCSTSPKRQIPHKRMNSDATPSHRSVLCSDELDHIDLERQAERLISSSRVPVSSVPKTDSSSPGSSPGRGTAIIRSNGEVTSLNHAESNPAQNDQVERHLDCRTLSNRAYTSSPSNFSPPEQLSISDTTNAVEEMDGNVELPRESGNYVNRPSIMERIRRSIFDFRSSSRGSKA